MILHQTYTEDNLSGPQFCGNIAYSLKNKAYENF